MRKRLWTLDCCRLSSVVCRLSSVVQQRLWTWNMIKTKVSIEIERPVSELFAFVTEVRNFPLWFGGIIHESKPETAGACAVGTKFTQTNSFLGRTFQTHFTVTEYELDKLFCVSTHWGPIP